MKNGETKGARPGFWDRLLGRGRAAESPVRNGLNAAGKACRDAGSGRMGLDADRSGRRAGETMTITLPGGAAMEMVWCPPGSFLMGGDWPSAKPLHRVTLTNGFWLAKFTVTQTQWKSVMGNNPSECRGMNLPMNNICWIDCQNFCRKTGLQMPTEAQWEYACRAGTLGEFAGSGNLIDMGWYSDNSDFQMHPVGTKLPNDWGLYDMHGNVFEWCSDWYDIDYYGKSPASDPVGPDSGEERILRGGCFFYKMEGCQSSYRGSDPPHKRASVFGFRPCCPARQT